SYMLSQGFKEVFHLKGGILRYLEVVPEAESRFAGECFVFDERVSVTHGLVEGEAVLCRATGRSPSAVRAARRISATTRPQSRRATGRRSWR
ncbi:MAG: hypothetical protein EOP61_39950, partial [Sphingomonadales bacterium]